MTTRKSLIDFPINIFVDGINVVPEEHHEVLMFRGLIAL